MERLELSLVSGSRFWTTGFKEGLTERCTPQNVLSHRHRAPGLTGKAFLYVPDGYSPKFDFPLSPASARLTHVEDRVWMQEIEFRESELEWAIPFEGPKSP